MDIRIPKLIALFKEQGEEVLYSESTVCTSSHTSKEYRIEKVNDETNNLISDKEKVIIDSMIESLAKLRLGDTYR
jgi:hypothetical protein